MNACAENTLLHLHTPAVRDLAWACFSPPLLHSARLQRDSDIDNCALEITSARRDWLQSLDRNPAPLLQHIGARQSSRLGIYFETLWQFFLQQDAEVELLAHNLPVRDTAGTLGEFDCIYFCHRRQRPVHLELAVKFYLQYSGQTRGDGDACTWLGPGARDRLDLKVQRLLQHQIRLSRHPRGAEKLAGLGAEKPLLEVEIKGRLYHHIDTPPQLPLGYNPQLALQPWCRASELPAIYAQWGNRLVHLPRLRWLAPVAETSDDSLVAADPALIDGTVIKRPVQLAALDTRGRELRRLFVVPDDWPDRHD